jgi:alpha-soluble NSF attachment protein|mmetsp:Transcript_15067/g.18151  ORF Transcript_15067/g.18151 Transcript_15067/m.18151 type:complete len:315 (-) Transcript_15067:829-1773(-)|eukprot:CAMPEP_0195269378 /NCGR_PEP_ID=MMETSP0706-20130129/13737_1 /TAXON_ID=33640 /ORGANISM="Asterionellopsis glacialis, Strain CCMP134" /LENGTH=314 /DNA_ID=CAMNT_0040324483 /DNA_START=88 /DNA_END=1032 /DNA_ORIENTATION=+
MSLVARQQKSKAEAFMAEAEKTVGKSTWFASSKERKFEDAAELYDKAANAYKVGGFNHEAGDAYTKAATIYRDELSSFMEASKSLSNAGQCYKKSSPSDAVGAFHSAIALMVDAGRLSQAAKMSKEVAELFENEDVPADDGEKSSIVAAIESYEQASELFGMENSNSQASQCMAKVAELCSGALDPPDLLRAARIYEDLGKGCLDSNLLKYNAKGHFLQSIMCHLANNDSIAASQALQRYESMDYTFGESREGKFSQQLVEAVEGFDTEGFATACFEYDRISKLDPWKTSILVRVKRSIDDEAGDDDDDEVDLT